VQQRAQNAAHMRIVIDDQETETVEIDAKHEAEGWSGLSWRQ
jgi:hypothetical protein